MNTLRLLLHLFRFLMSSGKARVGHWRALRRLAFERMGMKP